MTDDELLEGLAARTLPYSAWDHRAHVRVGFVLVRRHGYEGALERIRGYIRAYNDANADQVTTGYHETITRAFLALITAALRDTPDVAD